jgi:hypothetical protein
MLGRRADAKLSGSLHLCKTQAIYRSIVADCPQRSDRPQWVLAV